MIKKKIISALWKRKASELHSYTNSMVFDIWLTSAHSYWQTHLLTVLMPWILGASWFFPGPICVINLYFKTCHMFTALKSEDILFSHLLRLQSCQGPATGSRHSTLLLYCRACQNKHTHTTTRRADKGGRKWTLTFQLSTPYSKQENRYALKRHIKEIYCMPQQENLYQIPKCCHGPRA